VDASAEECYILADILDLEHHRTVKQKPDGVRLRREVVSFITSNFFRVLSGAVRLLPSSALSWRDVEVLPDIPYRDTGMVEHRLDIYRPACRAKSRTGGPLGSRPVVLYVHGGGFRFQSKDTHWLMGLIFARQGYLVLNINYRLAPRHPFPAAIADTCEAYLWMLQNATRYGGDVERLVLAGDSAGANLVTALTLAACYPRPEPFARRVWESGVVPGAVLPACGMLQVSDAERLSRGRKPSFLVHHRLEAVSSDYLSGAPPELSLDLADSLVFLERGEPPRRPLPPFFPAVGTADALMEDTRRLERALRKLNVTCEARYYKGGMHVFHAFLFRRKARRYWRDAFAFLKKNL
jgi:acetyl esterase